MLAVFYFVRTMGHTLVTHFEDESLNTIKEFLTGVNEEFSKIPYGRKCDRYYLDKVIPYHMTIASWKKERDAEYIEKLNDIHFESFVISATSVCTRIADEASTMLFLNIRPDEKYQQIAEQLNNMGIPIKDFLHITLAISKNPFKIRRIRKSVVETAAFPITLKVDGLSLFHLWDNCREVRRIQ